MNFFAVSTQGLETALEEELTEFGFKVLEKTPSGCYFESTLKGCYKANLMSTIASRILMPLHEGRARQGEELYNLMSEFDFTELFSPDKTIKIEASVKECSIHDQRFVAMKVKDVIADQFRAKFGRRPDVDTKFPQVQLFIKAYRDHYIISLDTSGDALFRRGYRLQQGLAPLKETLASGLLRYAGWRPGTTLVDPMCGSGTFLIEAALQMSKTAPGSFRKRFGFQDLKNFDKDTWQKVLDLHLAEEEITEGEPIKLFGFDVDSKVIQAAKENAKRAGVDHLIQFQKRSVTQLQAPADVPAGIVITNPPYAARLGEVDELKDVYRDFAHSLKNHFQGWDAWILSGNKDLIGDLKLKATRKIFVYNGPIECRFLKYELFAGAAEARVFRRKMELEERLATIHQ